jgi:hypothetical protein
MKRQRFLIKFALKYPDTWFNHAHDYESVSLMCATANLGIIELKGGMWILKSRDKANQWINAHEY